MKNELFARFLTWSLMDFFPQTAWDFIYLFAQTVDNEASVLERGFSLATQNESKKIVIPAGSARRGYPGYDAWRERLLVMGVSDADLGTTTDSPDGLNTLTEAQALVNYCKETAARSIVVVAAPFHQARAFLTVISVVLKQGVNLAVHSIPGQSLPWTATVVHSQGLLTRPRIDIVDDEVGRIGQYQQKGDLVSLKQALEYLKSRDDSYRDSVEKRGHTYTRDTH